MPRKSIWTQTEEAHRLEEGELGAVIYYSDRSYSVVTVFGPFSAMQALLVPTVWNKNPQVTLKRKSDLSEVPSEGSVVGGEKYGLKEGQKALLVSGYAPE